MLDYKIITFLKVCETMNFTRAADELGLTQPAVSRHIHLLEDEYGVKLFDYKNKRIALTAAGELLFRSATAMKNDDVLLAEELALAGEVRHEMRFGTTKTIGDFSVIKPFYAYLQNHGDIDMHMVIGNTEELLGKLRTGEINFALVEGYFDAGEFDSMVFSTEEFVAVCSADHKFKKGLVKSETFSVKIFLFVNQAQALATSLRKTSKPKTSTYHNSRIPSKSAVCT